MDNTLLGAIRWLKDVIHRHLVGQWVSWVKSFTVHHIAFSDLFTFSSSDTVPLNLGTATHKSMHQLTLFTYLLIFSTKLVK